MITETCDDVMLSFKKTAKLFYKIIHICSSFTGSNKYYNWVTCLTVIQRHSDRC